MTRPTISEIGDAWYESEARTGAAMASELQRLARRARVRKVLVIALATLVTAAVTYRVVTKERLLYAEIVLALSEQSLSSQKTGIPADQLRHYVTSVLLSDKNLLEIIEARNLYPLRRTLGPQFALGELWDQTEVEIWKNSFIYYQEEDANARKSARIGITVMDSDPDKAFAMARAIADIAVRTHRIERQKATREIAREVAQIRIAMEKRASDLTTAIMMKEATLAEAKKAHKHGLAAAMLVEITALDNEMKSVEDMLSQVAHSRDAIADQIAAAGLDVTLAVADERRPDRPEHSGFLMFLLIIVIGTGSLVGSAMFVGAFDSRIHDTDDVERLGLPVLGHLPGFAGDHVGSLTARGINRPREPLVRRWLSHR